MDSQQQGNKRATEIDANADNIEAANAGTETKSITNIHYDCLERIFKFLDLQSLVNVANTCKRLQIDAATYYGDVYGKRTVSLPIRSGNTWREPGCLPFLRCFGPKIFHLIVLYDERANDDDNDFVDRYINQYCAKTLKGITFSVSRGFSVDIFPNPFECVEEVRMVDVKLKEQLPHLVNLFPKLRKLDMARISVDGNCTAVHFPNLECLTIVFGSEGCFTMKNLSILLHANPQLQRLELGMDDKEITVNELLNTISQNPLITRLKLSSWSKSNINPADLMQIASERPQMVELDLPSHRIAPQDAINFIRQLKSLEMFRFLINDQAAYDYLASQLDNEWKHEHIISISNDLLTALKR